MFDETQVRRCPDCLETKMAKPLYVVHKQNHTLHAYGGCGHVAAYNKDKYDEYFTFDEAKAGHGNDLRPCKSCVSRDNLSKDLN